MMSLSSVQRVNRALIFGFAFFSANVGGAGRVLAHPGHGATSGSGLLHVLVEPGHGAVLSTFVVSALVVLAVLHFVAGWMTRSPLRNQ